MSRRLLAFSAALFACAAFSIAPRWTASASRSGGSAFGLASTPTALDQNPPPALGLAIVGSVVDGTLAPLAGVAVTLERDARVVQKTTTAADGTFRFAGVRPGDYRVRAALAGFPEFSKALRVRSGTASIQFPIVLARSGDTLASPRSEDLQSVATGVPPPLSAPMEAPAAALPRVANAGPTSAAGGRSVDLNATTDGISAVGRAQAAADVSAGSFGAERYWPGGWPRPSGESYAHIDPNQFRSARDEPLSTFGADVDTASYTNVRRFLSSGRMPPRDAVRVEELVNYFHFDYAEPRNKPVALTTEVGDCPWAPGHKLVLIGARARRPIPSEIEGRNLVLLVDVSGSMAPPERLPLIKTALGLFVDTLRPDDRLAIVTYAGTSGVALPSTPVGQRDVIQRAIQRLTAGGSTNGGQGLIMAYRTAREAFIPGGVNRVILATDGDFNVGIVSPHELLRLIEREKESGVFLSVFGVGSGNLKDSTMEMLADKGNGHYAYLDSLQEARRVLIREADATLETVAKDVKFQVEFNPAMVAHWKLIGYEDRALAARDFNDDRKDGGEMGAGHTVTVLYEVIPVGVRESDDYHIMRPDVDPLVYQPRAMPVTQSVDPRAGHAGEWLTVKVRYKLPEGEESDLISQPVRSGGQARHLPLASAVAEFGLLLRDRPGDTARWNALSGRVAGIEMPGAAAGENESFKELVSIAAGMSRMANRE